MNRTHILATGLAWLLLASCGKAVDGPIRVSAIASPPKLDNPNLKPLDPASAFLVEAAAEGLVRFDAAGQIEPGLAQSWIVSDDGIRYTFRLARMRWPDGTRMTAEQVVARLRAAGSRSSSNALKPLLGAIDEIVAMTDEVLEISLKSPRPNFLQLLAQPQMSIIFKGQGAGPYRPTWQEDGTVMLKLASAESEDEEEEEEADGSPPILLKGEPAALAVARFREGQSDLVIGGHVGNLPLARAAQPGNRLIFDPVAGLLGIAFERAEGPLSRPEVRRALNMAVDRASLASALAVPGLQTRLSLLPAGIDEQPQPAVPAWAANPLPMRRELAARTIDALPGTERLVVRVATPDGPGYRLVFAHLKRDWAAIGVDARQVGASEEAELRFVDLVAPARLASWYLRQFTCDTGRLCDPVADEDLAAARIAPNRAQRRLHLANADRILAETVVFIPIAAPIRWSLVAPRLSGFRPNMFGRHYAGELIAGGA